MPSSTVVLAVTAVFLGLWVLQLVWRIRWARGVKPVPGTPTGEFGLLSPAVVHLITANSDMSHDAAAATVIDLAARGFVDIEEVGPTLSLVRLRRQEGQLLPYERQVLDHLRGLADREGVVATNALAEGARDLDKWWESFSGSVVAEARHLGLTRKVRGFGSGMSLTGMVAFGLLGVWLDMLVIPWQGSYPTLALVPPVWFVGLFLMIAFDRRLKGERLTQRGRAAAGQWLTEREQLSRIGNISRLPAAAVTIWGRPFAYASALGLSRSVASLPIVMRRERDEAWSDQGGLWHKVRVRYPGQARGSGVIITLIFALWVATTLGASVWYALHDFRFNGFEPIAFSLMMLPGGGLVPLAIVVALAIPLGLITRLRWRSRITNARPEIPVAGKVIRRFDMPFTGQDPFVYIAIDDGSRTIDAVRATVERVGRLREGDEVRAWISRSGFLARLELASLE